jgi:hypothetical protein
MIISSVASGATVGFWLTLVLLGVGVPVVVSLQPDTSATRIMVATAIPTLWSPELIEIPSAVGTVL